MLKAEKLGRRMGTYKTLDYSKKDFRVGIRVSKEERDFLQALAKSKGMSLSNYVMATIYSSLDTTEQ